MIENKKLQKKILQGRKSLPWKYVADVKFNNMYRFISYTSIRAHRFSVITLSGFNIDNIRHSHLVSLNSFSRRLLPLTEESICVLRHLLTNRPSLSLRMSIIYPSCLFSSDYTSPDSFSFPLFSIFSHSISSIIRLIKFSGFSIQTKFIGFKQRIQCT